MADGATGRSMQDYAAVQRFANPDLTDDICALLRQYADNEDLTAFLLRMVWIGQLEGALPEAMNVALTPTAETVRSHSSIQGKQGDWFQRGSRACSSELSGRGF